MFARRCPRADELQAYVEEGRGATKITNHIETCEICFGIVADLRTQAELIDTVRQAVQVIDEKTRARAADICRELPRRAHGPETEHDG